MGGRRRRPWEEEAEIGVMPPQAEDRKVHVCKYVHMCVVTKVCARL